MPILSVRKSNEGKCPRSVVDRKQQNAGAKLLMKLVFWFVAILTLTSGVTSPANATTVDIALRAPNQTKYCGHLQVRYTYNKNIRAIGMSCVKAKKAIRNLKWVESTASYRLNARKQLKCTLKTVEPSAGNAVCKIHRRDAKSRPAGFRWRLYGT